MNKHTLTKKKQKTQCYRCSANEHYLGYVLTEAWAGGKLGS